MRKKKIAVIVSLVVAVALAVAVLFSLLPERGEDDGHSSVQPETKVTPAPGTLAEIAGGFEKEFGLEEGCILRDKVFLDHSGAETVTRELLAAVGVFVVNNSEEAGKLFVPVSTEIQSGRETEMFRSLYGGFSLDDSDSFSGLVLEKQKIQCERMDLIKNTYSDGSEQVILFLDRKDVSMIRPSDFENVSDEFRESTEKAFMYGIAPYDYSGSGFEILFLPGEKVTEEEIGKMLSRLKGTVSPDFAGAVSVDADGFRENCLLSSDFLPLIYAMKTFSEYSEERGILAPDGDMTGFGIWFTGEKYGTLCLPLNYCVTDPVRFVFSPPEVSAPDEKLENIALLFPESVRRDFIDRGREGLTGTGKKEFYICNVSCGFYGNKEEGYVLYAGTSYGEE